MVRKAQIRPQLCLPRAILSTLITRMIVGLIGSLDFISSRTIPTIDNRMISKSNWFHLMRMKHSLHSYAFKKKLKNKKVKALKITLMSDHTFL